VHPRSPELTLLEEVSAVLARAGIAHALIGATALAAHGVSRSTQDQDLLAVGAACLDPGLWAELRERGVSVDVRRGDLTDPLLGVVRFTVPGQRQVDLVVGKHTWQRSLLARAEEGRAGNPRVVQIVDLILLKLYAGGPQDAWDIQQILARSDRAQIIAAVEKDLGELPERCQAFWAKILSL
jgi:hypothetical protein